MTDENLTPLEEFMVELGLTDEDLEDEIDVNEDSDGEELDCL